MKKVYVTSGELKTVLMANGPVEAFTRALLEHSDGLTLDPRFIYMDERGNRTDDAKYKVPVEQALAEAGYVFDDDEDGGHAALLCVAPSGSPSAEE